MTITSVYFFAATALAAAIYRKLPLRFRNLWLLLLSIGFVASWSWQFVLLLALFVWVNFAIGMRMERKPTGMLAWSYMGLVFNVLFLFLIKYNNFYISELSHFLTRLGLMSSDQAVSILMPIGLSFLMVQAISYLLDLRNKRLHAETDLIKFSVYMLYFPKLLSGPIERARLFLPKLESPLAIDQPLLERSLALILIGLFRKIVLADALFNMIPADAFTSPLNYSGQFLLPYLLAYSFALYNDFAGYTSIVRGISLWFGIELSPNFNLPYLARNFTEFWARWHISLSNWLRDYIFFPFSRWLVKHKSRYTKVLNFVLPPIVTMLVSGLWHGLGWNLLVWGGLHGLYQVIERLPTLRKSPTPINERPKWRQGAATGVTFIFAALAWLPFHTTLPQAVQYLHGLLIWKKPDFWTLRLTLEGHIPLTSWKIFLLPDPILIGTLLLAILFDWLELRGKKDDFIRKWPRWAVILFVVILLAAVLLSAFSDQIAPFVYQSF